MEGTSTKLNEVFYQTVKGGIDRQISAAKIPTPELLTHLQTLLESGADINCKNNEEFGRTPLHCAAEIGYLPVVEFLKNNGSDIEAVDTRNQTPLIIASINGHLKVIEYLISYGASVDKPDKFGCTALIRAALGGHLEIVKRLVENGAEIEAANYGFGANALHEAAYWGHLPVVEFLVGKSARLEQRDNDGRTALYRATTMEHKDVIIFLVNAGADVNARTSNNETPLHIAALYGHESVINYLIKRGADLEAMNGEGLTPYDFATKSDKIQEPKKSKIVKMFKEFKEKLTLDALEKIQEDLSQDLSILDKLSIDNKYEFEQLLKYGWYKSYENRLYLAGPCNVGKTTLASLLIGKPIPQNWESTNGLEIFFGRSGIDLKAMKMIPLPENIGPIEDVVYKRIIQGRPSVQTERQNSEMDWPDLETDVVVVPENMNSNTDSDTVPKEHLFEHAECYHSSESNPPYSTEIYTRLGSQTTQRTILPAKIQEDILDRIRKKEYKMEIAPCDIVDFGGQRAFDMTHQLFIQHRGAVLLLFDGSRPMNVKLDEYTHGDATTNSILHHWVNSILTYCTECNDNMPQILFVATHSDRYESKKDKRREEMMDELDRQFGNHEKRKHLRYENLFFINATDNKDTEIDRLKETLVQLAVSQNTWEQLLPMAWVPLLLQLDDLRSKGSNIITRHQLQVLNKRNEDLALNETQLQQFLKHQHSTGKILYFDEPVLKDFITIQPSGLVNILRSIVTDEKFWPDRYRSIFLNINRTGKLKKSDLLLIWSDEKFKRDLPSDEHKKFVIELLLRLDILIEPKILKNEKNEYSDFFFIPCMVTENIDWKNLLPSDRSEQKICLSYQLALPSVPPTLSFRLIGATLSTWPIKKQDENACLYNNLAVIYIDENNDILIRTEKKRIVIYLLNRHIISKDLTSVIQECITSALTRIISFYRKSFSNVIVSNDSKLFHVEVGFFCNGSPCLLPLDVAMKTKNWECVKNKNEQHVTHLPLCWFFSQESHECPADCKGLPASDLNKCPTNKQLMRFVRNFGIKTFKTFANSLEVKHHVIENLEYKYNDPYIVMFMTLYKWKQHENLPKFTDLLQGLLKSGLDCCLLCKATRESTVLCERIEMESRTTLQVVPGDYVLRQLSTKIGDCLMQLGIELGLKVEEIEAVWYKHTSSMTTMSEDVYDILMKWKQSSKTKPTVFKLMLALDYVDKRGLKFLLHYYLNKTLDCVYS